MARHHKVASSCGAKVTHRQFTLLLKLRQSVPSRRRSNLLVGCCFRPAAHVFLCCAMQREAAFCAGLAHFLVASGALSVTHVWRFVFLMFPSFCFFLFLFVYALVWVEEACGKRCSHFCRRAPLLLGGCVRYCHLCCKPTSLLFIRRPRNHSGHGLSFGRTNSLSETTRKNGTDIRREKEKNF